MPSNDYAIGSPVCAMDASWRHTSAGVVADATNANQKGAPSAPSGRR